jgi:hypothetical protein
VATITPLAATGRNLPTEILFARSGAFLSQPPTGDSHRRPFASSQRRIDGIVVTDGQIDAELKAIANLAAAKRALDQKVAELKGAGETAFQPVKVDVEVRVAEFAKSVQAIASKINAR